MIVVLEAAAATHGDEPRIPDLGEDHQSAHLAALSAKGRHRSRPPTRLPMVGRSPSTGKRDDGQEPSPLAIGYGLSVPTTGYWDVCAWPRHLVDKCVDGGDGMAVARDAVECHRVPRRDGGPFVSEVRCGAPSAVNASWYSTRTVRRVRGPSGRHWAWCSSAVMSCGTT